LRNGVFIVEHNLIDFCGKICADSINDIVIAVLSLNEFGYLIGNFLLDWIIESVTSVWGFRDIE
jgi:hypothetical protein